ncbi:MAG: beta-class carbonic anhydrase [Limisphaerales bacterium]
MRLFEAIVDANHRAGLVPAKPELKRADLADSLPVVALTCIDPRLNALLPGALGIGPEDFIWLRNAGNIIFDPLSTMMRTLALACALKGGREIAIIGHTDCRVRQTTVMDLIERFRALGIDRAQLPENLNEFFGLFASERQNVIGGVEVVRGSPLIGPQIPVHGLLIDVASGHLEWIVNGYQSLATPLRATASKTKPTEPSLGATASLAGFNLDEMKFPETKIGEAVATLVSALPETPVPAPAPEPSPAAAPATPRPDVKLDPSLRYRIIGSDQKMYGPVLGAKVLEWLAEGRIDSQTPAQKEDEAEWKPLAAFNDLVSSGRIPLPPRLQDALHKFKRKR